MDKNIYKEWVFHDVHPIYIQLRDKIKCAILSGQLQPGEGIPSFRKMASILHVNPNTVARAYRLVKDEGLIELTKGGICKVISDNVSIQEIRAKEIHILCFDYARGMIALGINKEESYFFIEDYIRRKM